MKIYLMWFPWRICLFGCCATSWTFTAFTLFCTDSDSSFEFVIWFAFAVYDWFELLAVSVSAGSFFLRVIVRLCVSSLCVCLGLDWFCDWGYGFRLWYLNWVLVDEGLWVCDLIGFMVIWCDYVRLGKVYEVCECLELLVVTNWSCVISFAG